MKRGYFFILLFLILNTFFYSTSISYAQSSHLIISEVQISGNDDFIELYNPTGVDVDLAAGSYRIERATQSGGDPSILIRFGDSSDGSFPGGNVIVAGGYYLVVRDDASQSLLDIADAIGTRDDFTLTDNNTLYLGTGAISNKSDSDIVDFVGYGTAVDFEGSAGAPLPDSNQTTGRKFSGSYLDTDNNGDDLEIQISTPKAQNQTYIAPPPEVYSDKILINEFLPAPGTSIDWDSDGTADSSDEWIEIINLDDYEIDLEGWILDDIESGGSSPYTIPADTKIDPDGFLVFYKKDTGIVLNNTGDSVILKNPDGEIADQYSYTSTQTDKSFSRNNNSASSSWVTNYSPSPDALNTAPANQYPIANAGSNINNAKTGENVNFNGSASYDPDGSIISWEWNFGDGQSGSGASTSHSYSTAGTYQVTLTVRDSNNAASSSIISVIVVENTNPNPYVNQYSSNIKIIEFMPNPEGSESDNEYIKLFDNGSGDINLRNWSLDDEEGGSKPFKIDYDVLIKVGSSVTFYRSDTKITINNNGDTIRLFDPDNKIMDSVTFSSSAPEGIAYIYENEKWQWQGTQTDADEETQADAEEIKNNNNSLPAVTPKQVNEAKNIKLILPAPEKKIISKIEEEKIKVSNYNPIILVDSGVIGAKTALVEKDFSDEVLKKAEDFSGNNPVSVPKNSRRPFVFSPYFVLPFMAFAVAAIIKFIILPKNLYEFLDKFIKDKEKNEVIEKLFGEEK